MGTPGPMSGKEAELIQAVRRAEEALEELTALGLSVDIVLSNRIVVKPGHLPVEQGDTLSEGEGALAYLNNPEVADCILVLGSQHIKASSAYLSRWSPFFKACFEHDMAEKASRIVNVEPPSVKYFVTTIEYLYTGLLPASALESGDVLFGLLVNAHYLSCNRLVKECLTHLETALKSDGYKVFTSHAGFNSGLVPSDLVKRHLPDSSTYMMWRGALPEASVRQTLLKALDIMLDWLDKEGAISEEGDWMATECEQILHHVTFNKEECMRLFKNFRANVAYARVLTLGLVRILDQRAPQWQRS